MHLKPRKSYSVYIIASRSLNFYIGVTSNLHKRIWQHKHGLLSDFPSRYKICRLVYFESFDDIRSAIDREKQLKRWSRAKKIELVRRVNPTWIDLSEGWYVNAGSSASASLRSGFARDDSAR